LSISALFPNPNTKQITQQRLFFPLGSGLSQKATFAIYEGVILGFFFSASFLRFLTATPMQLCSVVLSALLSIRTLTNMQSSPSLESC
jgi:hypothetical protein